ncbi:unnamed protein product [Fusarium graminearum]|nr:unnamed protein product [Fusarium graminearum]
MDLSNKAAYLVSPNGPTIEVRSAPVPTPGPGELLVKTHAVAINPVDAVKQSMGNMMFEWLSYPLILGYDVAGEVIKTGPGVGRFKEGDRVVGVTAGMDKRGRCPDEGAFQEICIVREHLAAKIPDGITSTDASVLPLTFVTAACALFQKEQLALQLPQTKANRSSTGQTVLVWGASTSVGRNAVQLAVAAGYDVIATASPKNWDIVRNLGASSVFDYRSPTVIDDVITSLKEKKCAGAVAIGQGSLAKCVDIIKRIPGATKNVAQVTLSMPESQPTTKISMIPFVAKYFWMAGTDRLKVMSSGVQSKFVFGTDIIEWDAEGKLASYLSEALELGEYNLSSRAQVLEGGLSSIAQGLDLVREGTDETDIISFTLLKMANYASTSTAYPSSVYSLLARINHLSETVRRMPYDFPILDRAQRRLGLVNLTFNLPSREFMRLLHEDLSKVSFEMDIVLSHLSDEENPGLRVYLVHKLESVQSAFNKIYTVVLNLALLRLLMHDLVERT